MRIEAGRRAWGAELGPDETPLEAGTMFAVKVAKRDDFIGKTALVRAAAEPLRKKLVTVVVDEAERWLWGGETLLVDGEPAGEVASAGWSDRAGRSIGLAYLRGAAAAYAHAGSPLTVDLWGESVPSAAWDVWPPAARP